MLRTLIRRGLILTQVLPKSNITGCHLVSRRFCESRTNPFRGESQTERKPSSQAPTIDREKKLKILALELEMAYQEGRRVPELAFLSDQNWEHILTLPSKSARFKYYTFLWQVEKKKESAKVKKEERAVAVQARKEELRKQSEECDHIIYGLSRTTMFLRIYDSAINSFNNNKLVQAMRFGEKIVIDCSYDDQMNRHEAVNTAKQLGLCFAENRLHDQPFDLHYCNASLNKLTMKTLHRQIPTMLDTDFPMNVHEKCFTELFPLQNLVYLTPHCRTDLVEYNPDDIYIIGGIVDKVSNDPLSLAKAKRLGLRMAKLPLDKYLNWGAGSGKSLTLNQMVNILLDLKQTKDWNKALKHVPKRKLVDFDREPQFQERKLRQRIEKLAFNPNQWGASSKKVQ
ncbi:TRMT10C family protein [Megaselia abdita]